MQLKCTVCNRKAKIGFTFKEVGMTHMICEGCGEKAVPPAARCVVCGNPAAAATYLAVSFANFPWMPRVITPTCSRKCQNIDIARDPPSEPGKETYRGCVVCNSRLPEEKTVQCSKCNVEYCSEKCKENAAAVHTKECTPLPVGNMRPCELAFAVGDKYAFFDHPLVFPGGMIADIYRMTNPPPPPGISWEKVFEREPKREITFDALMDIAKGITEHGKKFELFVDDDKVEFAHPEEFGTRELAEAWAKHLFANSRWEVKPIAA